MKFTQWLRSWTVTLIKAKKTEQKYQDDTRFFYLLIIVRHETEKYTRVYSTSSPLGIGHRIVLTPSKSFIVSALIHVTYPTDLSTVQTRPTTFVHAGLTTSPESTVTEGDLLKIGFAKSEDDFPYTLH